MPLMPVFSSGAERVLIGSQDADDEAALRQTTKLDGT